MVQEESYKEKNFILAEILACVSFILNTISVVLAERGGSFAPAWVPIFNWIYWLKTILAAMGLFYFLTSKVFTTKEEKSGGPKKGTKKDKEPG